MTEDITKKNNTQNTSTENIVENNNSSENIKRRVNPNRKPVAHRVSNNKTDSSANTSLENEKNISSDNSDSLKIQPNAKPNPRPYKRTPRNTKKNPVKIIPLGGLGEVGKNITAYEYGNDMFLVDCGLAFPSEEMLGVDIVIPDFTYLEKNFDRIKGIVITHGHEDHIGALPYLLKSCNIPVYATKLTIGLIEGKLKEHGLLGKVRLNIIKPRDKIKFGNMFVEFIRVNHSIPDAVALAIHTPVGVIIQTGDFKIDYTPIDNNVIDLAYFGELGNKGVLALLSDSTNAEKPGSTKSERSVGESFEKLFYKAENKRIIIATFASNIHRVQQIIDMAEKTNRKVIVSGRSMVNVCNKALELGYLKAPKDIIVEMEALNRLDHSEIVLVTTGSQGEPLSALTRMSSCDHKQISISSNDFIIFSATPIPGNEKCVSRVVNDLMKLGAEVIYERMYDVHVSGHACQDELKLILALTRPKFFMPVHGEFKHLVKHAQIAKSMGIPDENIVIGENGDVVELSNSQIKIVNKVIAGRVLVDGLGVGDVGSVVLRDRKHLAQDGLIIVITTIERSTGKLVAGPDIVSRGFVYVRESEELMDDAQTVVKKVLTDCMTNNIREWGIIKTRVRDELNSFVYNRTKRNPMILPIIMEF